MGQMYIHIYTYIYIFHQYLTFRYFDLDAQKLTYLLGPVPV